MLKLFLDANVIYSGLLYGGKEHQLLEYGRLCVCGLYTNEYVLEEIERVFREKLKMPKEDADLLIAYTRECVGVLANPNPTTVKSFLKTLKDKKDAPVAAGVQESGCNYLVTGDKELLNQKKIKAIKTTEAIEKIMHP
jgi:putative PIN family toxin of toxin-antitoxin system